MRRRVMIIGAVLLIIFMAGLFVPYVMKARLQANIAASHNNLRELALFAAHHTNPNETRNAGKSPLEIPAGTILLPGTQPTERLSWVVDVLPGVDQRKLNTEALKSIDRTKPWRAEVNQQAGRTRLAVLLVAENTPEVLPGEPAITCYVGVGGLGANAATLPADSPRVGAMRYDEPTPFTRIADGLGQTLLFGETRHEVGPWLRGGPSTVRGLDDTPGAIPLVGSGGQFGGYFPETVNFALCDGSVRVFTTRVDSRVLFALSTIAGKDSDPIPGE